MSHPTVALVEPEVKAWQEYVTKVGEAFPFEGAEIFAQAAAEFGNLGSQLAAAPFSELMSELELRRGLKFQYFTPWHVKTRETLGLFMKQELSKEYSVEKAEAEEAVLKVLGLVPLDFEIVPFMTELLTDAVAGVYDPTVDQFFLVDMDSGEGLTGRLKNTATKRLLGDMNSVIIIHELDHALGGQHFPLRSTFEKLSQDSTMDERMAIQALVEGDATFVMMDHQNKSLPTLAGSKTVVAGTDALTDILLNFPIPLPGMGKIAEAPLFFKKSLIFPYYGGAEFVSFLRHQAKDWEMVNQAYHDFPSSTEEIYHPGRYHSLNRKPDIPDLKKLPESFGPWVKVKDETGGEFLLRIVLEQYGVKDYRYAADGWHGDRLRVFRHRETGALGFYWVIRWDNEFEAQDFYRSLGSSLPFVVEQEETLSFLSLAFDEKQLATLRASLGEHP